jgi:predicted RNase H-like HicB family nuclease
MSRTYEAEAHWDSEAGVWVAESEDIPGLVAEAESMNALVEKVRVLVPELFELNGGLEPGQKVVNVLVRAHHDSNGFGLSRRARASGFGHSCHWTRLRLGIH